MPTTNPNTPRVLDVQAILQQVTPAEAVTILSMAAQTVLIKPMRELSALPWDQLRSTEGVTRKVTDIIEGCALKAAVRETVGA